MTHPVIVRTTQAVSPTTQAVSPSEQTTRCVYKQKLAMLKLHHQQQRRCPSSFKVNGCLLSHQNRLDPHINHVIVFPKWISKIGVTQSNPNVNISSVVLSLSLFFSLFVFLCFFVWSLLWGLLPANSMADFSHYFQICSKNSIRKMVLVTAFTHYRELIKSMVCVCFFVSPCLVLYVAS